MIFESLQMALISASRSRGSERTSADVLPSAGVTDPSGAKVVPSTRNSWGVPEISTTMNYDAKKSVSNALILLGVRTLETLIWLVVRVPVLSEQMTFVQPSVSTLGRLRTIAFF